MKPPYLILVQCGEMQEDGFFDEPLEMESFSTLGAASVYIQDYWQGLDCMESMHRFYTDYAYYVLVNFSLESIGKFVKEPDKNWQYYFFDPVSEEDYREAEEKQRQEQFRNSLTCEKCGSRDLAISGDSRCGNYKCHACGAGLTWID
jgi:hypothetical protein